AISGAAVRTTPTKRSSGGSSGCGCSARMASSHTSPVRGGGEVAAETPLRTPATMSLRCKASTRRSASSMMSAEAAFSRSSPLRRAPAPVPRPFGSAMACCPCSSGSTATLTRPGPPGCPQGREPGETRRRFRGGSARRPGRAPGGGDNGRAGPLLPRRSDHYWIPKENGFYPSVAFVVTVVTFPRLTPFAQEHHVREFSRPVKVEISPGARLPDTVFARAAEEPGTVALRRQESGQWRDVTCKEFRDDVVALAKALIAAGIEHGDRVGLIARTR